MTFLSVYQSWTEFVKIRWYNYNSLNSQVTKCHVLKIFKNLLTPSFHCKDMMV